MKGIISIVYKIFRSHFLFALFTLFLIITSENVWAQKSYKTVSPDGKLQVTSNYEKEWDERELTINMAQGGEFAARRFLAAGEQSKNQDFFYGINVHPQYGAGPYRSSNLEKWMHLAANLGVTIIRANHSSGGGWSATDDFLTLCEAYGIDVMLHLENSRNPESMRAVAERYKGRIKYYGISNEQETSCLKTGVRRNNEYGNPIEDFDPEKLDNRANEMKSNIAAIKEAYPEAIVTYSIISGYDVFAKAMKDRGVEIDVICANMYFNDDSDATIARINNSITKLVQATGVPAIFAEFNVGYSVREVVSADAATATMYPKYFDAFRNNPDLLGVIVYELLDEANYTNKEAHFGLVKTNNIFEIGEYKVSYNAYKDYIRGKGAPEIPMKKMSR